MTVHAPRHCDREQTELARQSGTPAAPPPSTGDAPRNPGVFTAPETELNTVQTVKVKGPPHSPANWKGLAVHPETTCRACQQPATVFKVIRIKSSPPTWQAVCETCAPVEERRAVVHDFLLLLWRMRMARPALPAGDAAARPVPDETDYTYTLIHSESRPLSTRAPQTTDLTSVYPDQFLADFEAEWLDWEAKHLHTYVWVRSPLSLHLDALTDELLAQTTPPPAPPVNRRWLDAWKTAHDGKPRGAFSPEAFNVENAQRPTWRTPRPFRANEVERQRARRKAAKAARKRAAHSRQRNRRAA